MQNHPVPHVIKSSENIDIATHAPSRTQKRSKEKERREDLHGKAGLSFI